MLNTQTDWTVESISTIMFGNVNKFSHDECSLQYRPAVHHPDGERRTVHLLLRQLHVQEPHVVGEVRVLVGVLNDGALYDVTPALHVHPWLVHREELDPLEVPQSPEEDLEPVLHQGRSDLGRDGHDGAGAGRGLVLDRRQRRKRTAGVAQLEHLEGGEQFARLLVAAVDLEPVQLGVSVVNLPVPI